MIVHLVLLLSNVSFSFGKGRSIYLYANIFLQISVQFFPDSDVYFTWVNFFILSFFQLFEQDLEQKWRESLIVLISPLLERYRPSLEMCQLFSDHCRKYPRSPSVQEAFNTCIHHILIHNVVSIFSCNIIIWFYEIELNYKIRGTLWERKEKKKILVDLGTNLVKISLHYSTFIFKIAKYWI